MATESRGEKLEGVLRTFTDDPEVIAAFFDGVGITSPALSPEALLAKQRAGEERLRLFQRHVERCRYADALRLAKEYPFAVAFTEVRQAALAKCREEERKSLGVALETAQAYHLTEMLPALAAAYGAYLLEDVGRGCETLIKLVRQELSGDGNFRRRAVRAVYGYWVRHGLHGSHSDLPGLVAEFRDCFSEEEVGLAEFLAIARKRRRGL